MSAALQEPSVWRAHANVLSALMLRDVRTRMGSAPAFLIVILWPLSHILLLVAWYIWSGRLAPFGDSMAIWAALGVVTFMSFSYVSRFTMMSLLANKPLLHFPVISILHIIVARGLLETLNIGLVILVIVALFTGLGIEIAPRNLPGVAAALMVAVGIGLGAGLCVGLIAAAAPAVAMFYTLFIIFLWITSGVLFVPSALPESVLEYLSYHPLLHCIEWARSAYYEDYNSKILDKSYALGWVIALIFIGLASERLFRGRFLK